MKNGTGLPKETAAALATLLGPTIIVPILFLLIEKDEYVRFWSMQSIITFLFLELIPWVLGLTIILAPLLVIVMPASMLAIVLLWLIYTYKSWQGERWVAPIVGKIAENMLKKIK